MKQREIAIILATQHGYLNQSILFNAGFTFSEVQEIKKEIAKSKQTATQ